MPCVVAVLETMYDWRSMTSGAGFREAPRYFTINPKNNSGRRLYKLVAGAGTLLVTNACKELVRSAQQHGTPNPAWLAENLRELESEHGIDLLLACGKVAQATYRSCGVHVHQVMEIPHPAARTCWTQQFLQETSAAIHAALQTASNRQGGQH